MERAEPLPVTFISSHAQLGGAERYVELLVGGLGRDWVREVVVLQEGPFVGRIQNLGLPLTVVPTPARLGVLAAAMRLRRVLIRRRPAVIHANGIKAALLAVMATTRTAIPVVWVKHDCSWDGLVARAVAARCRQVVGVSATVMEVFGGAGGNRFHVVPNGLPEIDVDRRAARVLVLDLIGCRADARLVALVGRMTPVKGQLEFVEAAAEILERRDAVHFLIVGPGDPYSRGYARLVRRRVEDLGIRHSVTFTGQRDDAVRILSGCDVAVMPTVQDARVTGTEGSPFVAIESLTVGTPIVGYANGALPEVLGDCAKLVDPGDRAGLRDGVIRLLDDKTLWDQLAACGRGRARERFTLESTVAGMIERYRAAAHG